MNLSISTALAILFNLQVIECVIFSWLWSADPLEQSSLSNNTSSGHKKAVMKKVRIQQLSLLRLLDFEHFYILLLYT